jgi:alpha-galactosidase
MGHDLRNASKQTLEILTNRDAISINQDSLGVAGFRYATRDSVHVWCKPLKNGEWAVTFLNRGTKAVNFEFDWKSEAIADPLLGYKLDTKATTFSWVDIWNKKFTGTTKDKLKCLIAGHDAVLLKLSAKPKKK